MPKSNLSRVYIYSGCVQKSPDLRGTYSQWPDVLIRQLTKFKLGSLHRTNYTACHCEERSDVAISRYNVEMIDAVMLRLQPKECVI